MNEKQRLIKDYITKAECNYMCDDEPFNCISCSCFEECYIKADIRCGKDFADSVDCSGYNTEEDFWEQI